MFDILFWHVGGLWGVTPNMLPFFKFISYFDLLRYFKIDMNARIYHKATLPNNETIYYQAAN